MGDTGGPPSSSLGFRGTLDPSSYRLVVIPAALSSLPPRRVGPVWGCFQGAFPMGLSVLCGHLLIPMIPAPPLPLPAPRDQPRFPTAKSQGLEGESSLKTGTRQKSSHPTEWGAHVTAWLGGGHRPECVCFSSNISSGPRKSVLALSRLWGAEMTGTAPSVGVCPA